MRLPALPSRPCLNCGRDINVLARLYGRPPPHRNRKYCGKACKLAAERRRKYSQRETQ
jgi:hypothetical protein